MNIVTLECRECKEHDNLQGNPKFATDYNPSGIQDMQEYMDINYHVRCDICFSCDWEVVATTKSVGALDVSNRTATSNISVQ